jgi:GT2 family glycosyltransferase
VVEVSAVVVSWNTRELLRACLESFSAEVEAGRVEVCVVDNASADGSAEMVRDEFGWAELVVSEENAGFGAAVNRGLASARGEWLAIANADVALTGGALDALVAAGQADAGAGAVAPRLVLPDGSTQHSVFAFPSVGFTLGFNAGLARVLPRWGERHVVPGRWDPDRARRVPWAIAAFLLVRREAWAQAGGFDERQWMYAEDLDLGWRLQRAGWATRYVPHARVRHASGAATAQAWGEEATARWQRSTYAWMLWRRGAVRTRLVAAINVAGALARGALQPAARERMHWWASVHRQGLAPRRELERHR